MSDSQNLALPYIEASQAQKHVTHNEALRALDALVQLAVKDRDLATPPGSPADGDRYIVAASPTGAWSGHAADIAVFQDGAWDFHDPKEGWRSWVEDENVFLIFNGSAWVDWGAALGVLQNLSLLGIGTTADATNPFSAKLNKALWTAKYAGDGGDGDLRYTMNKEATSDTVSLLLQKAFSGRAEMGLIGDDDLLFKVSADGSTWFDGLRINKSTGVVTFPVSSPGGVREKLTANRTYYVRTDGSNANTGLANTSGGAFVTLQKAIDVIVQTLDVAGFTVTIQMGDGTYASGGTIKEWVGGGAIGIVGNTGNMDAVIISAATGIQNAATYSGVVTVSYVKLTGTTFGLFLPYGGALRFHHINFAGTATYHIMADHPAAILIREGPCTVSAGAQVHILCRLGVFYSGITQTITVTGTPAFAIAFAYAGFAGKLLDLSTTYSGAATGKRYNANNLSLMQTAGGGASFYPGDVAGTTDTGGVYV